MADKPFQGEEMSCMLCGKKEMSDPAVPSGWRCLIGGDGNRYYACPDEFPRGAGVVQSFGVSYIRILVDVLRGSPDPE